MFELIEKIWYSKEERLKSRSTGVHLFETYAKILYVSPLFFFQTTEKDSSITILNFFDNIESYDSNSIIFGDLMNHRLINFFK